MGDPSCYVLDAPDSVPEASSSLPPASAYGSYGFRPSLVYNEVGDEEPLPSGEDVDGDEHEDGGDEGGDDDLHFDLSYQLPGKADPDVQSEETDRSSYILEANGAPPSLPSRVDNMEEEDNDGRGTYALSPERPTRCSSGLGEQGRSLQGSSSVVYATPVGEVDSEAEGSTPISTPRAGESVSTSAPPARGNPRSLRLTPQERKDLQWNEIFQNLYGEMRERHREGHPSLKVYTKLSHHAHDFLSAAETYGKIIISERYLANDLKTIKPVDMGGAAGGTKYICRGILFKFSVDTKIPGVIQKQAQVYMYGGKKPCDEKAMKSGSHELKGLEGYFHSGVDELHCPLMVIIDYRGYRLTAMSTLPIGSDTLLYGSNDAGKTVRADNLRLNEAMEKAGQHLNLASHLVGDKMITGPGDIEGHIGRDGRFYVIDYARTFPPEGPPPDLDKWDRRAVFYEMLRPELVSRYPHQLSSDAFSNWQQHEPRMKSLNDQVKKARSFLHEVVIPEFAEKLKDPRFTEMFFPAHGHPSFLFDLKHDEKDERMLLYEMHKQGINMRHLGRVRACLLADTGDRPEIVVQAPPAHPWLDASQAQLSPFDRVKALLLAEMVARVIKNLVRKKMRRLFRKSKLPSEEPYRALFCKVMNSVLYNSEDIRFWERKIRKPLLKKFGNTALAPEEHDGATICQVIKDAQLEPILIRRILQMTSISIGESPWTALLHNPFGRLQPSDIIVIVARVKYQSVIDYSEGVATFMKAKKERRRAVDALNLPKHDMNGGLIGAAPDYHRLLSYAKGKLYLSLTVNTQHTAGKLYMGCALLEMCKLPTGPMHDSLERAIVTLEECMAAGEQNPLLPFMHGEGLCFRAAWECLSSKQSVTEHPDMTKGLALLEQSLDLSKGGVLQGKLSYANTLYKDCKGLYTHTICKGPLLVSLTLPFVEFGVHITNLIVRLLREYDVSTRSEGPALAASDPIPKNESENRHQSDASRAWKSDHGTRRLTVVQPELRESKGKGKLGEEIVDEEAECVDEGKPALGEDQLDRNKMRRLRTSAALLGANMRIAQGLAHAGDLRADLWLRGQQIIRDTLAEEPTLARDLLMDCSGSLRRYKRVLHEWQAPVHLRRTVETEFVILRLRAAVEVLPTAGELLSLRDEVAAKLREAEEQAAIDAEIIAAAAAPASATSS